MKNFLKFLPVIFCLVLFSCTDPVPTDLAKGKNIDIDRMEGTVVRKEVRYFTGDQTHTKELVGKPYYILAINRGGSEETFIGVSDLAFDSVEVNTILPVIPMASLNHLAELKGFVVDMDRDLFSNKFIIIVEKDGEMKRYRVQLQIYYELWKKFKSEGILSLPIDLKK